MLKLNLSINFFILLIFSLTFAKETNLNITSNKLFMSKNQNYMEFTGNVKVIYNKNIIKAEKVLVYKNKDKSFKDEDGIEKIIAIQNVDINIENSKKAWSDNLEYIGSKKLFILTGPNSKIIDEKNNQIIADKIKYYQERDEIIAENKSDSNNKPMEITIKQ